MSGWAVEVNEAAIWATGQGAEWWNHFRLRMEPTGRIAVITPSIGGDRCMSLATERTMLAHCGNSWPATGSTSAPSECAERR